MTDSSAHGNAVHGKTRKSNRRPAKSNRMAPPSNGEILVKGAVMGMIISGLTHASKSITGTLVRHPLALFSSGLVAGFLTHKYRREIIVLGYRTADESKNFVLRQKENLGDFLAEASRGSKIDHNGD